MRGRDYMISTEIGKRSSLKGPEKLESPGFAAQSGINISQFK